MSSVFPEKLSRLMVNERIAYFTTGIAAVGFARWPDGSAISSEERERAKALWDGLPRDAESWGDTADESGAQLSRMLRPELYYTTGEWLKARARHYMSIPPWQLLRKLRGKLRAQRKRRILI